MTSQEKRALTTALKVLTDISCTSLIEVRKLAGIPEKELKLLDAYQQEIFELIEKISPEDKRNKR